MCFFFFFKQKTAYEMRISDWSSDVCSSDLRREAASATPPTTGALTGCSGVRLEPEHCAPRESPYCGQSSPVYGSGSANVATAVMSNFPVAKTRADRKSVV